MRKARSRGLATARRVRGAPTKRFIAGEGPSPIWLAPSATHDCSSHALSSTHLLTVDEMEHGDTEQCGGDQPDPRVRKLVHLRNLERERRTMLRRSNSGGKVRFKRRLEILYEIHKSFFVAQEIFLLRVDCLHGHWLWRWESFRANLLAGSKVFF